jgi:hypothetical protein
MTMTKHGAANSVASHDLFEARFGRFMREHVGGWQQCASCGRETWQTQNGCCNHCRNFDIPITYRGPAPYSSNRPIVQSHEI